MPPDSLTHRDLGIPLDSTPPEYALVSILATPFDESDGKAHLHGIGLTIASTCELATLVQVLGTACGQIIFDQSHARKAASTVTIFAPSKAGVAGGGGDPGPGNRKGPSLVTKVALGG